MRTPGQVDAEAYKTISSETRFIESKQGDEIARVHNIDNAEFVKAAWNACDRLGLTAEQLNADTIGRLVEAAKKVVGESKNPPKVTWAEDGSPIVDCHDGVSEFLTNWRELESALAPFTK